MYEYIRGKLEEQNMNYVVIDHLGLGLKIYVSTSTLSELPPIGEEIQLHLFPIFKEDDLSLYGFITKDEREIFHTVIGISGIGPKVGMALLSQYSRNELIKHIVHEDVKAITKTAGIGKKTAERIILELKDKYKNMILSEEDLQIGGAIEKTREQDTLFNDATNALLGLGYTYAEANTLIEKVLHPGMSIEEVIKAALMNANKF